MDTSTAGLSLAQGFLLLAKAKHTGILTVSGETQRCRAAIIEGKLHAISAGFGIDEPLGDSLLRTGELDRDLHQHALAIEEPRYPVGAWLIDRGLAKRAAVEGALYKQMRTRMVQLFRFGKLDYQFTHGDPQIGIPLIQKGIASVEVILEVFRSRVSEYSRSQIVDRIGHGRWQTTGLGQAVLKGIALSMEEEQLVRKLHRGCDIDEIYSEFQTSESVLQTLFVFYLLGIIINRCCIQASYSLLLRKQRQLRNAASPDTLLDLPIGASSAQARKALRQLAAHLHPDRLGPDAPNALIKASEEVMAALCSAEIGLRERTVGPLSI